MTTYCVVEKEYIMRKRIISAVLLLTMALLMICAPITAFAKDYSESWSGNTGIISVSNRTNTLYYRNPHGNFKLRIYVTTQWHQIGVSKQYSIQMYDNAGRCVWSANNQGDRTYDIGGNVTKIVITTNAAVGPTLHWQRK